MHKLVDENLYLVGGAVRDEFLNLPSIDTDYCYEGNAIEFATRKNLNIIRENSSLGTVKVLIDGKEVDIASTREEVYSKKGHLPTVISLGCSLAQDLKRRDFTINAMAKRTTDGVIIDIYGGKNDIKNKKLRVLHRESFIDDPTRIVRALKFSVRFGFNLDEESNILKNKYLNNINYDMSYHRLKKELKETFNLNKEIALQKFIAENIYKLLGKSQVVPAFIPKLENELNNLANKNDIWLFYLCNFDLSKLDLSRQEKRILKCYNELNNRPPNNNTPKESIIMHKIWKERVI